MVPTVVATLVARLVATLVATLVARLVATLVVLMVARLVTLVVTLWRRYQYGALAPQSGPHAPLVQLAFQLLPALPMLPPKRLAVVELCHDFLSEAYRPIMKKQKEVHITCQWPTIDYLIYIYNIYIYLHLIHLLLSAFDEDLYVPLQRPAWPGKKKTSIGNKTTGTQMLRWSSKDHFMVIDEKNKQKKQYVPVDAHLVQLPLL